MLFNFPKKRIGDTGWFLKESELVIFGMVKLITMAISEEGVKIYYRFIDENDIEYTVAEEQVLENDVLVPTPKYNVGDGVIYTRLTEEKKHEQVADVIISSEISIYERGAIEICYVMKNDPDEWVTEDEILCHGEPLIDIKKETMEDGYTEYDHCVGNRSDI